MAGIGFELRRVLTRGGSLLQAVRALMSGVFIVAGPWVLTVLTIYIVQAVAGRELAASSGQFQAAVTYTYAASLILFSPLQYFFTRLISDSVWQRRTGEASWYLFWFVLAAAALAATLTWGVADVFFPPSTHPLEVKMAWAGFAASINALWITMLFISVLKWYGRILLIYLAGTLASLGLMAWWGAQYGLAGTLGGLAAGNGLITAGLLFLSWLGHPPQKPRRPLARAGRVLGRNGWLILCGFLNALGLWLDKFFFWAWKGQPVPGSGFFLFNEYDEVVYQTSLAIIPGLVFFIIVTETAFATKVVRFVQGLNSKTYREIRLRQADLSRTVESEGLKLAWFQVLVVVCSVLWLVVNTHGVEPVVVIGFASASVQILLMVVLTFLFYLELQRDAAMIGLIFVVTTALGCGVQMLLPWLPPGVSYLLGTSTATICGTVLLRRRMGSLDRLLFGR